MTLLRRATGRRGATYTTWRLIVGAPAVSERLLAGSSARDTAITDSLTAKRTHFRRTQLTAEGFLSTTAAAYLRHG